MATHELFTNRNGTVSLRELRSGEVMHSCVGPRDEATLLYIEQSRLAERLAQAENGELVLWDAGLGAASNALAAFQEAARTKAARAGVVRPLKIISFENDLSGLRLAFENRASLPFFEGFEAAVAGLLDRGEWNSDDGLLGWRVLEGDFQARVAEAPVPEVVFYDFYSPKSSPELWSPEVFTLLRAACKSERPAALYTYSASTRIRAAMLVSGFFVGYGRSTGFKIDTTVAATTLAELERPLDARWLLRLERSEEPLPYGWDASRRGELLAAIGRHPQFREISRA